jgi:hypothetical protein
VVVASVASAQNEEWSRALSELRGDALKLRPNPLGGAPIPQIALPNVGQQLAQFKPPPWGGDQPIAPNPGPRPLRPAFTLPGAPKLDRHGDPLPAGAVARFGTVRLRHGANVQAMAFTHDAKLLCTVSSSDESVRLWDTTTGKEVSRLNTGANFVALAKDGSVLIVDDARIKVWLPATNTVRDLPEKTLPDGATPTALAVNPDGRSFALAINGKVVLIDAQTGKTLKELNLPGNPPNNPNPGALAPAPPNPPNGNVPPTPPPVKHLY